MSISCSQMKDANYAKQSYLTANPIPVSVAFDSVFKDQTWTTNELENGKSLIEFTGILKSDVLENEEYGSNVLAEYYFSNYADIIMLDDSGKKIEKIGKSMPSVGLTNDTLWSFSWINDTHTNNCELVRTMAIIDEESSRKLLEINKISNKIQ